MTTSLLDILRRSQAIEEEIIASGGELSFESEAALNSVNLDLADKVDATQLVLERLEKSAEYWREKAEQYKKISTALEEARDRIRGHIKWIMADSGRNEIVGEDIRYRLVSARAKVIVDEARISEAYKRQIVTYVPDVERIRQDLELGVPVEGASLVPVNALRTYFNKKAA